MEARGTDAMTVLAQKPGPVRDDDDNVRKIPLRNMKRDIVGYAYVDADDFERVDSFKWHMCAVASHTYAKSHMLMHKFVLGEPPEGKVIDHWNGDCLDNRRCNLRFASRSVNSHNRKKRKGASSSFFGVSKKGRLWIAQMRGRQLGSFELEIHAAYMYDLAAIDVYGEFANVNGVPEPEGWRLPEPKKIIQRRVKEPVLNDALEITRTEDGVAYVVARGTRVLVSDEDWHTVQTRTWSINRYPSTNINGARIRMHKLLMGDRKGFKVDHINGDKCDNRRTNLRWATASENGQNVGPRNGSTGRGYQFHTNGCTAKITSNGKYHYLGRYKNVEHAMLAYNHAARQLFGEHAYQNDVAEDPEYFWDQEKMRLLRKVA